MPENFWTTAQNVLTLFLLILAGAGCRRLRLLDEATVKGCANLVLYLATPCVILQACIREFDSALLWGFLIAAAAALVNHLLLIVAVRRIFRDADDGRQRVLRFAAVFSNAGYMAIPLQQALLGDEGVFYSAAYLVVFNIVMWTYGVAEMSGDPKTLSAKRLLTNPGILAVLLGLLLFVLPVPVPGVLRSALGHLAALNTPIPMLIVGYYLAGANISSALRDRRLWLCLLLRLAAAPAVALGLLLLCGVRGTLLTSLMICISTPVATATTMFAARYDREPLLSVDLVSLSTLLSVVTLPAFVALTGYLGSIV